MQQRLIYHICPQSAWDDAKSLGHYAGSADDRRDGFIHFSAEAQLRQSAAKHHGGKSGLVLLTVDPARLGAALRWEESRGGALFPHLYGTLAADAVVRADELPLDPQTGIHRFPASIPTPDGGG